MKQITGSFSNPDGSPVANGRVFFQLNQECHAIGGPQLTEGSLVGFTLDFNGALPTDSMIWATDELFPSGTTYTVSALDSGGGLVWLSNNTTISGTSPIDLNNITPN